MIVGDIKNVQVDSDVQIESLETVDDDESDQNYGNRNLKFVRDVPLLVQVELGQLSLKVRDLLKLAKGSVLEINKLAGEPLEILINGKIVCRGEVIVVNEKYGVRMTDIIKPNENVLSNAKSIQS